MFTELNQNELTSVDGGNPLAAVGILVGIAVGIYQLGCAYGEYKANQFYNQTPVRV